MATFLGIDTSNYTTSLALYNSETNEVRQAKLLLPVKEGEIGLRQSDAVFHHTKQLPDLFEQLYDKNYDISAVCVSNKPRNIEGSYMPCFLSGVSCATAISKTIDIPLFFTSHQVGHILAALYSSNKLDLIKQEFIAFHLSGGTTDCLLVSPSDDEVITINQISSSLDLKAGQAVDRIGVMLGLKFPAGKELEVLAQNSTKLFKIKPSVKDLDISLSGVENKCKQMISNNEDKCDIARYCLDYIAVSLLEMTRRAIEKFGELPLVYAGGVMSNKYIKGKVLKEFKTAYFASPEYSCDNATGVAIYSAIKYGEINE